MLWKAYDNNAMKYTANMMMYLQGKKINNRLFERLRIERNRITSEALKGTMTVKDKDGNTFKARCDDPQVLSGEWTCTFKGMTHTEENKQHLSEYFKGTVIVRDKDGNTYVTTVDDPDYVSGKVVHINKGRKHSDKSRKNMSDSRQGIMTYKDKNGNTFRVHKNDPRVLSGELVHIMKGTTQSEENVKKRLQKIKTNKAYITPFGVYGRLKNICAPLGISEPTVIGMCRKSLEKITSSEYYTNKYLRNNFPPSIIDTLTYEDLCFGIEYFDEE